MGRMKREPYQLVSLHWLKMAIDLIKAGLSPSKKIFFICFNESPSKMKKNAFYFILKAPFVLKIFNFLS